MRLFFALIVLISLSACGPRDDENLMNGGGNSNDFNLNSGETVVTEKANEKLPSCQKEDQPTWDSVRLFKELSFMYDKADQLQVVVGKGSFNCVKVSEQEPIEIEFQQDGWQGSGHYYFVTKLEMKNTSDFLADQEALRKVALGMQMSEDQLKSFLNSQPQQPQITLTYLKRTDEKPIEKEQYSLAKGLKISTEEEFAKLPSCENDKETWKSLQASFLYKEKIKDLEDLKVLVGVGAKNCYQVNTEESLPFKIAEEDGAKKYEFTDLFYHVTELMILHGETLLKDEKLFSKVAGESLLGEEKLKEILASEENSGLVTLTFVVKGEKTVTSGKPVFVYSKDGIKASPEKCVRDGVEETWTSIRIYPKEEGLLKSAIESSQLKVVVSMGEKNCLVIGKEGVFAFKKDGKFVDDKRKFIVKNVTVRDKSDYIKDPVLTDYVGLEMGIGGESLLEILGFIEEERVNVTRIKWVK